jgi:Holliday junction resolvase RusA-like endonuclease
VSWIRYDIVPVAKPRQTQRDKWAQRPCVMRYRAFADEVRLRKVDLPEHPHVLFVLPMPRTWSKRQKDASRGLSHLTKPDASNLWKALEDALYIDDAHLWDARISKVWGDAGAIYIRALPPPELP